jgi:predicted TPR repeat methyltransferase
LQRDNIAVNWHKRGEIESKGMDKIIDVAQIMRDIRAQIIPDDQEIFDLTLKSEDDVLTPHLNELNRIFDFIARTRNDSSEHLDIGKRLPAFNRFNALMKKILIFLARVVRKAARVITRDQIIVNYNVDKCLKALVESDAEILRSVVALKDEMERFSKAGKDARQTLHTQLMGQIAELRAEFDQDERIENITLPPDMYLRFEDKFRGSEKEISDRLKYYLDKYVYKYISKSEGDLIVDLGCGRGEWLALLKENGYHAKGVDLNEIMIQTCLEKDTDAVLADATDFLRKQEAKTIKAVTAYQLIEHLKVRQLTELLVEIHRVLKPGGITILETPNANNVAVGSYSFYLDPTHRRPVHQEYIRFLAKEIGFGTAEIAYWKEDEIQQWFNSVVSADEETVTKSAMLRTLAESVKNIVYTSPDYALIAIK